MLHIYMRRGGAGYALLGDALALHGISTLPTILRTHKGKPYFPHYPHLHFNLSHSEDFLLCALSDQPVGVDIEVIRPRRTGLPRYCFTPMEFARFEALGGDWAAFYTLWTLKEAWCKCLGQELGHPSHWPTPPPCPHQTYILEGVRASVCAGEHPPDLCPL